MVIKFKSSAKLVAIAISAFSCAKPRVESSIEPIQFVESLEASIQAGPATGNSFLKMIDDERMLGSSIRAKKPTETLAIFRHSEYDLRKLDRELTQKGCGVVCTTMKQLPFKDSEQFEARLGTLFIILPFIPKYLREDGEITRETLPLLNYFVSLQYDDDPKVKDLVRNIKRWANTEQPFSDPQLLALFATYSN